ncbi:hypothetical protein [Frankia sp. CiP3]|uniref:hypothetical protein n=1 Tax=Frankia sp. CiP3 TaxID=2880971 RepID=UPI001EF53917|nr:hypothetical protein [Frankia sp. CiP3]
MPGNLLTAPPFPTVLPDIDSVAYQTARRILEDHPVTASMPPMDLSALAQHLANVITDGLVDEIDDLRTDLADAHTALTAATKDLRAVRRELGQVRRGIVTDGTRVAS